MSSCPVPPRPRSSANSPTRCSSSQVRTSSLKASSEGDKEKSIALRRYRDMPGAAASALGDTRRTAHAPLTDTGAWNPCYSTGFHLRRRERGGLMAEAGRTLEEAEAILTAPGAPFETVEEDVLGERMTVFKNRYRNLRDMLAASAAFGDKEYVYFDDGRRLTFEEHLAVVGSVAAALRDRYDIGPGDRVAILGANSLEWLLTFWATVSLDAIAVAMNGWWQ